MFKFGRISLTRIISKFIFLQIFKVSTYPLYNYKNIIFLKITYNFNNFIGWQNAIIFSGLMCIYGYSLCS